MFYHIRVAHGIWESINWFFSTTLSSSDEVSTCWRYMYHCCRVGIGWCLSCSVYVSGAGESLTGWCFLLCPGNWQAARLHVASPAWRPWRTGIVVRLGAVMSVGVKRAANSQPLGSYKRRQNRILTKGTRQSTLSKRPTCRLHHETHSRRYGEKKSKPIAISSHSVSIRFQD